MDLKRTLELLRDHPAVLGVDGSFGQAAAFIEGVNVGQQGGMLAGFREWLVFRAGDGANLNWRGLLLRLALPDGYQGGLAGLSSDDEQKLIGMLFDQLGEFLAARESADGLLRIYDAYLKWLRNQDWYTSDSPSYLE